MVTWLVIRMRTEGALYLELFFSLNLLILLILRPNTLSCTQSYHDIEFKIRGKGRLSDIPFFPHSIFNPLCIKIHVLSLYIYNDNTCILIQVFTKI